MPQRLYTLDELKLNGIETLSLLSPVDTTLGSIERNLQIAAILGGLAAWNAFGISPQQIFYISLGLLFLWTLDAVLTQTWRSFHFTRFMKWSFSRRVICSMLVCIFCWSNQLLTLAFACLGSLFSFLMLCLFKLLRYAVSMFRFVSNTHMNKKCYFR